MNFQPVEANLRESFRALAAGRDRADVTELSGVTLASLGVTFQMFNAAFLNEPVETRSALIQRVEMACRHFDSKKMPWSFWVCEDWIAGDVRRAVSRVCADFGLRFVSDLPGLAAVELEAGRSRPVDLEIVEVASTSRMLDFRAVGALCFRVPPAWFAEVFRDEVWRGGRFRCFVGYRDGAPVATSALLEDWGVAGIYNVATLPGQRHRGYAEAVTRHAIRAARRADTAILQSTAEGGRMYRKMGFRDVTRILVYAS